MNCLTDEQLVQVALAQGDQQLVEHLAGCETCRSRLAQYSHLTARLSAIHADANRSHTTARERLLASLDRVEMTTRSRLSPIAAVGLAAAALAAAVLLMIVNPLSRLSAMERMAKAVREVTSYSYRTTEHVVHKQKHKPGHVLVDLDQLFYWKSPLWCREELIIVNKPSPPEAGTPHSVDILVINPVGTPGIVIDREIKTYYRIPELRPEDMPSGSTTYPLKLFCAIREQTGKVTQDLGTQKIAEVEAHGQEVDYEGLSPLTVWLDPQTDLPVEIEMKSKDETTSSVLRIHDFQWDVEIDSKLFDATPPAGYVDITPPGDEKQIAQIIDALRLYASLSGGHYPELEQFDRAAMRTKIESFGPPSAVDLDQTIAALESASKIILRKGITGYFASTVGPTDRDKILLWWAEPQPGSYRVIYGDLRSEVLSEEAWKKIAPPEVKWGDEEPTKEEP